MECRCGAASATSEEFSHLLRDIDLLDLFEQLDLARRSIVTMERRMRKAELVDALGLGAQVADLHRAAADRDNAQAARQLDASLLRLEDRVGRGDWAELITSFRASFVEHDGPTVLADVKARVRLALYEGSDLDGEQGRALASVVDSQLDALARDGVDAVATVLREAIRNASAARDSPGLGRTPRSALSPNQEFCLFSTAAKYTALFNTCFTTWFCWCCLAPILAVAEAAEMAACLAS
jgi:hypothetical protein